MNSITNLATPTTSWPTAPPTVGTAYRVYGDSAPANYSSGVWKSGLFATEAPIPDGYVPPTPENCIEMKSYPSVRRAEGSAFMPLFNHINS